MIDKAVEQGEREVLLVVTIATMAV
jgi:hypothetical protein